MTFSFTQLMYILQTLKEKCVNGLQIQTQPRLSVEKIMHFLIVILSVYSVMEVNEKPLQLKRNIMRFAKKKKKDPPENPLSIFHLSPPHLDFYLKYQYFNALPLCSYHFIRQFNDKNP